MKVIFKFQHIQIQKFNYLLHFKMVETTESKVELLLEAIDR